MNKLEQSENVVTGDRYQRCWLDGGVQVWVLLEDDHELLKPGLLERVKLAAALCVEELRKSPVA